MYPNKPQQEALRQSIGKNTHVDISGNEVMKQPTVMAMIACLESNLESTAETVIKLEQSFGFVLLPDMPSPVKQEAKLTSSVSSAFVERLDKINEQLRSLRIRLDEIIDRNTLQ